MKASIVWQKHSIHWRTQVMTGCWIKRINNRKTAKKSICRARRVGQNLCPGDQGNEMYSLTLLLQKLKEPQVFHVLPPMESSVTTMKKMRMNKKKSRLKKSVKLKKKKKLWTKSLIQKILMRSATKLFRMGVTLAKAVNQLEILKRMTKSEPILEIHQLLLSRLSSTPSQPVISMALINLINATPKSILKSFQMTNDLGIPVAEQSDSRKEW